MDKDKKEALNRKKSEETFNSVTQKRKPENQNQTHNIRSAAVEPKKPTSIKRPGGRFCFAWIAEKSNL